MRVAVAALIVALAWPWAAPAQEPPGAPLRLVPSAPAAAPPPDMAPTKPPNTDAAPTGFQAMPLGPLDPSWADALPKGEAGLPADFWQGTSRATVRALLPLLGPSESPGLRALARRLLLSGAAAPAGTDPPSEPSLLLLRAERLTAMGAITGAKRVLDSVPPDKSGEAADRLRIELAFAGNDITDGCKRVADGLAAHRNVWWDQANIACQLLSGAPDKAALALDILHDNGAAPDPAFDALVAAAQGRPATLENGAALSPLRITLWAAGKKPLPEAALAAADAATLAAFAGDNAEPTTNRVAAAERAALLGAWPAARLGDLYVKASAPEADRAKAVADSGNGDTPLGRANLYAAAQQAGDAAPRIVALGQFLDAARRHGLFAVAARLAAPIILAIGPGDGVKSAAPQFIRVLIAAGLATEIEPFVLLADPAEIGPLVAIVHAVAGGRFRPDDKAMGEAAAALALRPSDATPRQIGLFLMLTTEFRGAVPAPELAAQMAPGHAATLPSAALWLAQQQAEAAHRIGETVLTSLALAEQGERLTGEPILLGRSIAGLRAVGLNSDARALALEAAIDGGL